MGGNGFNPHGGGSFENVEVTVLFHASPAPITSDLPLGLYSHYIKAFNILMERFPQQVMGSIPTKEVFLKNWQ